MHRSGIAAAAALVALDTMVERIADDHRHARELGALLAAIPGIRLEPEVIETNIVLADVSGTGLSSEELIPLLAAAGLRVFERDPTRIRFVTHRLVGDAETEEAAAIVADVVERHAVPPPEEPEVEGLDEYLAWEAEQIQAIERGEPTRDEASARSEGGVSSMPSSASESRWTMLSITSGSIAGIPGPNASPVTDRSPRSSVAR